MREYIVKRRENKLPLTDLEDCDHIFWMWSHKVKESYRRVNTIFRTHPKREPQSKMRSFGRQSKMNHLLFRTEKWYTNWLGSQLRLNRRGKKG